MRDIIEGWRGKKMSSLFTGLVSYWRLEEGNGQVRYDVVGQNRMSQVGAGTLNAVEGKRGNGIDCPGDGTVTVPNLAKVAPIGVPAGPISISLWYKPDGLNANEHLISNMDDDLNSKAWTFYVSITTGELNWFTFDSGSTTLTTTGYGVTLNQWNHCAITQDGSKNAKIYLNGTERASGTATVQVLNTTRDLYICGRKRASSRIPEGILDEIGLWNKVLSPTEVATIYNGGIGLFYPFASQTSILISSGNATGNVIQVSV